MDHLGSNVARVANITNLDIVLDNVIIEIMVYLIISIPLLSPFNSLGIETKAMVLNSKGEAEELRKPYCALLLPGDLRSREYY